MASSKAKEDGDNGDNGHPHLLSLESPATPSPTPDPAKPKRSITPRGPIFSNLNDAHRNITSRLAPTNPFRKPAAEDQSSKEDIPLQELSSPVLPYTHEDAVPAGQLRRNVSEFVSTNPSRLAMGRCLTDCRSFMKPRDSAFTTEDNSLSTMAASESQGVEDPQAPPKATRNVDVIAKSQQPDASDSTVCRIVNHYATSDDGPTPFSNSNPEPSKDQEVTPQVATLKLPLRSITRLAFRDVGSRGSLESGKESKQSQTIKVIPGTTNLIKPVVIGLRDEPISGRSSIPSAPHTSPLPATQAVERPLTQSLVPRPLRIPANREFREPVETRLTLGSSNNDATSSEWPVGGAELTESNDDPFVYDNTRYRRMQQLGKEREISRALKCMSGSETATEISTVSSSTSPEKLARYSPKKPKVGSSPVERRAYVDGSFFDPVAFRALHGDTGDVRVVISRGPGWVGGQENKQPSTRPNGLSMHVNVGQNGRSAREPTEGDWVTEATSEIDLDIAVPDDHLRNQAIKETGSSIADYSDDYETDHVHQFPSRLGSRDPMIQHPPGESDTNSYETHKLKDTNQTVLLHRPQFPRFNGFGQNSSRLESQAPKQVGSQKGITNPFRRDYKRADASSYFSFKPGREASSKYEFRDSASTRGSVTGSNQAAHGTKATLPHSMSPLNTAKLQDSKADPFFDGGSIRLPKTRANNNIPARGHSRRPVALNLPSHIHQLPEKDQVEPQTPVSMARDTGDGPTTASSKFSFKLLDLSEAQELQKQQRESGETDETEDSTVRYHRACSDSPNNRSPLESLTQPSPTYLRSASQVKKASMLSSYFMVPPWRHSGSKNVSSATMNRTRLSGYTEPAMTPQNRMLPLDKRVCPARSGRMLFRGIRQDVEFIQGPEEYFVSHKAHSRLKVFFYGMLGLSIFPFFALLALNGNFDSLLSWLTDGEISQMTKKQRKILKIVFVVECIILASLIGGVVAYYATAASRGH